MILLDTHIFLWFNLDTENIPGNIYTKLINEEKWGISAISLWEVAMLDAYRRISLPCPVLEWFQSAIKGADWPRLIGGS